MKYVKQPLSIEEQIMKLKARRLVIDNDAIASDYLSNISYSSGAMGITKIRNMIN
ncbi:MAG TPA: hypothetical protein PKW37_08750 [Salinivirgaceae bacterium]|nr:hypothetical protein [Salinivirgaceae bacterium]